MSQKKPQKPKAEKKPLPVEEMDEEVEVIFIDDRDDPYYSPEWYEVYEKLRFEEGDKDARTKSVQDGLRAVVAALEDGQPMPKNVRMFLADMLDPHKEWAGPRLKLMVPQKQTKKSKLKKLGDQRQIRVEYQRRMTEDGPGKHDAIVRDLMKKYGCQRTKITDALKISDKDIVYRSLNLIGRRNIA